MNRSIAYQPLTVTQRILVLLFLAIGGWYLAWRPTTFNPDALFFSWAIYAAELFGFMTALLHLMMTWRLTERPTPPPEKGLTVDIFIPTYNEPLEVVRRTLLAALAMDYPHKVWLLDDGRRPEMAELARTLGCHYLTRSDNHEAKAGNLNNALLHSSGELIAIFDADHAPHRSFLQRTLGQFRDPQVAFVQTPQDFYNLDSFQHRASRKSSFVWTEQALFFRIIQRGKDYWNAAFFCGSCAVIRRSALERIGGFATGTITEDLHTSLRLHMEGYKSVYLPESLAFGIAPSAIAPFLHQRLRWGQGAMQVWKREGILFNRRLSWIQRLNYFASAVTYFEGWQKVVFYAAPVVVLTTGTMPLITSGPEFLLHFIPYYLLSFWVFEEVGRGYGHIILTEQYNLARFATFLSATLGFFRDRLRFIVTDKGKGNEQGDYRRSTMPQFTVLFANAMAIPIGLLLFALYHHVPLDGFVANLIWAGFNVVLAFGLLSFTRRASNHRRGEYRFRIPVPAHIEFGHGHSEGVTVDDLSASGFRFYGRLPELMATDALLTGTLQLPGGPVAFTARVRSLHRAQLMDEQGQSSSYIKAVGCQFEGTSEIAKARIERFLYGSDLQWRVNALSERQRTPLERLLGRNRQDATLAKMGGRLWAACMVSSHHPAQGARPAVISVGEERQRWLLSSTQPQSGQALHLEVYSRTGTTELAARVGSWEVVETADSPIYLIRLKAVVTARKSCPSEALPATLAPATHIA